MQTATQPVMAPLAALGTPTAPANGTNNLDASSMFKFIVAQMQNQSPMDPTNSDNMMQEVAIMQMAQETAQLRTDTDNFQAVQGLSQAATMIGHTATVLDPNAGPVTGQVTSVTMSNGQVSVNIGGNAYPMSQIQSVQ